jgi:GTP cyclohydrolase II
LEAELIQTHRLHNRALGEVQVSVYQRGAETALVLQYNEIEDAETTAVRIQSACAYGEVLLSTSCDCRDQLEESYEIFARRRSGVLIYLDQEGRGAGLSAKAKAYAVEQSLGVDTVDAYEHLSLPLDQRDYTIASQILSQLNAGNIALLTNNTRKLEQLRSGGFKVTREHCEQP